MWNIISNFLQPIYDDSTASDMSDILDDMDDYLDEAMAHNSSNSAGPTPSKQGKVQPSVSKFLILFFNIDNV